MGIISVGVAPTSGRFSQDKKKVKLIEEYIVQTSYYLDGLADILPYFAELYEPHPSLSYLQLESKDGDRVAEGSLAWKIELQWETPGENDPGASNGTENQNPTYETPSIRGYPEGGEEPCETFFDENNVANALILRNSAYDLYPNPVSRLSNNFCVEICRNEDINTNPLAVYYTYGNSVNSTTWSIFPAGYVLLTAPSFERKQKTIEGEVYHYWAITYTLKARSIGWDEVLPDIGPHFWEGVKKTFTSENGTSYIGLLDGAGFQLCDDPEAECTAPPVFLPPLRKYRRTDFNALALPDPANGLDFRGWSLS